MGGLGAMGGEIYRVWAAAVSFYPVVIEWGTRKYRDLHPTHTLTHLRRHNAKLLVDNLGRSKARLKFSLPEWGA